MSSPEMEDFSRIKRLPPHVFAIVNELKAAARTAKISSIWHGNPDQPTPRHIVDMAGSRRRNGGHPSLFGVTWYSACAVPSATGTRIGSTSSWTRRPEPSSPLGRKKVYTRAGLHGTRRLGAGAESGLSGSILYGFIIAGADVRHVPMTPEHDFFEGAQGNRRVGHAQDAGGQLPRQSDPGCVDLEFFERVIRSPTCEQYLGDP